jgi:very-short-patch-repair endonuclease
MPAECRLNTPQAHQSDTRPDLLVAARAAEEWGVLSTDELRECGLSLNAIVVRVRNGRLHPLHRGVYAVGHTNLQLEGRFLAAVKACGPGAHLSHFSAAALYGFLPWDDRYPEVTVPGSNKPKHARIRTHRTTTPDPTRHKNIPITTPARTLVDLAATLPYKPLRRAVRQAQRLVSPRQILATMHDLGARRGTANLTRILATGPAPTRSELEDAVLDLLLKGGIPHPDVNRPLTIDGRRVIPDFRWPQYRLVVEADGAEWHDDRLAREDDAERQALLEAHGERVLRVTWKQAVARRAETLARVRAAQAMASSQ